MSKETQTQLGHEASAEGVGSVALGSWAKATAIDSAAIGSDSVANEKATVSFGYNNEDGRLTRRLVNVSEGKKPSDAVTVSQLNALVARIKALEA